MKATHRADLFCWSVFNEEKNIDFNGWVWVRPQGNIVIDPMPLCDHDWAHLESLGGAAWVVVTNSDHTRAATAVCERFGAQLAGPAGEQSDFALPVDRWLQDGDPLVPGLLALALQGSKTPGELALLLEDSTLITGDLVRAHRAGSLMMLPDPKLTDKAAACASVQRLADLPGIQAVLVGDGWPVFRDGGALLRELAQTI